ncbi:MAG: hypothetical protein ITG00_03340 [Flavobacterium sp.]|nr:hypothetical protein [Flavobacterium sp.]
MSKERRAYGMIAFLLLLTVIFTVLKITGPLADWSWFKASFPLWFPITFIVGTAIGLWLFGLARAIAARIP